MYSLGERRGLADYIADSDVGLLRSDYLIGMRKAGNPIPRRQSLPE
eukprot:gene15921-9927_t